MQTHRIKETFVFVYIIFMRERIYINYKYIKKYTHADCVLKGSNTNSDRNEDYSALACRDDRSIIRL